jgi:hypothetical protein
VVADVVLEGDLVVGGHGLVHRVVVAHIEEDDPLIFDQ